MLGAVRIIESLAMVDQVEDWSKVRSPGRARRRRHKHRQNIRIMEVPKKHALATDGGRTLIMHPEMARQLRHEIVNQSRIIPELRPDPTSVYFGFNLPFISMADIA